MKKGFSLIEMLIAVSLFAIVSIIATQSLASSLKSSRKSESLSKARENVDYAISTMERLLRNATDITTCTSSQLTYIDEYGTSANLRCLPAGSTIGYIASGAATLVRLTSSSVNIDCSGTTFSCPGPTPGVPRTVQITVTGEDANLGAGAEGASVTSQTKVNLRYYTLD